VSVVRRLASWLAQLIRFLAYGWAVSLFVVVRQVVRSICAWFHRRALPERERKVSHDDCVSVPRGTVSRPDPLIYSQLELMGLGLAVTWDNPDVQLYRNGTAVSSSDLAPATEYEVVARVWNNSTQASVVALPVKFFVLSFGIGTTLDLIEVTTIPVLGVKGGPNHPAFASVRWTTPSVPGHYCLQVILDPVDDENVGNNIGSENTLVGVAHSPAAFAFQLRNASDRRQQFHFEVDTYELPPIPPCGEAEVVPDRQPDTGPLIARASNRRVPPQHDRRNYPVPDGWSVSIVPAEPQLGSRDSIEIHVEITPPIGFAGRAAFNVNGFDDAGLRGGVTLHVQSA
jgi:hypothetical protein